MIVETSLRVDNVVYCPKLGRNSAILRLWKPYHFAPYMKFLLCFKVHVGSLRSTSRGYVKLKSVDPYDYPVINPNYLSTEDDRVELRDSIKLTREIFKQKALDPFRRKELQPGIHNK